MAAVNEDEEKEEAPRRQQTVAGAIKTGTNAVVGFTSSLAHLRTSAAGSAPGSAASAAPEGSTGAGSLARMRIRRARPRRDVEEGISDGEAATGGEVMSWAPCASRRRLRRAALGRVGRPPAPEQQ